MDCLGIGDSDWLPEGPLAVIHHDERAVDVSQAIDALEPMGFDDICVAGVCSGAFLAFRSALQDVRVKRLLLVNPQFWLPLSDEQLADPLQGTFGATSTYVAKAFSADAWRRVLKRQVNLRALLSIAREMAARGARALVARFSRLFKFANATSRLERELSALGERGCRTLLVFSASDPAREIFAEHMTANNMSRSPKGLEIETVWGADHVFATQSARAVFQRILTRVLSRDEHGSSADAQRTDCPLERNTTSLCEQAERRVRRLEPASKPI
jgi:dienelactone hydrolase